MADARGVGAAAAGGSTLIAVLGCAGVTALACGPAVGSWWYATSAAPLVKTIAWVESDPGVAQALGAPVHVRTFVSTEMDRDLWHRNGRDRVDVITGVVGANGTGRLTVRAENYNEQGWVGTWDVWLDAGTARLVDGHYETGARELAEGTFATDGAPVPKVQTP